MEASIDTFNYFDYLANENLIGIFGLLDTKSFSQVTSTCKRFSHVRIDFTLPVTAETKVLQQIDTIRSLLLTESRTEDLSIIRETYTMNLYWDNKGTIRAYTGDDTGLLMRKKENEPLTFCLNGEQISPDWQQLCIVWTHDEGIMFKSLPDKRIREYIMDFTTTLYAAAKAIEKENPNERWQFTVTDSKKYPTAFLLHRKNDHMDITN